MARQRAAFHSQETYRPSDDHLLITRIVADRVGAELDRQIFLERAAETAAMRERASIMRDLHDGLLQNLTAARAQLEMLPADGEYAKMQLDRTRELLRTEQRVREFVDQIHAADNENAVLETLRPLAEETTRFLGLCVVAFSSLPRRSSHGKWRISCLSCSPKPLPTRSVTVWRVQWK